MRRSQFLTLLGGVAVGQAARRPRAQRDNDYVATLKVDEGAPESRSCDL